MTELKPSTKNKWWKHPDVKKTFIFWLIFTPAIGIFGTQFHVLSMPDPASEVMSGVIGLMRLFTWAASPVAALVFAICATALTSSRHYGDNPPADADHQISNSPRANALWIVISAVMCLFALVVGLIVLQKDGDALHEAGAINVNVTGQQWAWNYDYANGARSEVLYLPVDVPVIFHITSKDVKHSFWIVEMGIKMDANPGYTTETAVTPNKIGVFNVRCAELCGLLHAYMQNKVHVVSKADYEKWLADRSALEARS
jgi:cytochrome c oxidase subunit 2